MFKKLSITLTQITKINLKSFILVWVNSAVYYTVDFRDNKACGAA